MIHAAHAYLTTLNASVGAHWNRFWFTPTTPRVLGYIRAVVGLACLWAIASYRADLREFFGPEGMLPVEYVRELFPSQHSLLDHALSGRATVFWAISLAVLASATLGLGGRLGQLAALIVALSFFHRASLTNGPAEAILTFLLIYLCLGRAGASFSLAAWWNGRRGGSQAFAAAAPRVSNTIALRLIQIHIALVCLMMAAAQLAAQGGVWFSGEGMWLAAQSPEAWIDWNWLANEPKLTALWSHLVTLFLWAFPLLAWRPLLTPLLCAWGAFTWLSVAAATGDTLFALAMIAGSLAFLARPARLGPSLPD